jgi:hypothetical protein
MWRVRVGLGAPGKTWYDGDDERVVEAEEVRL